MPYLRPGGSAPVTLWTPQAGISTEGRLTYAPEPGTGWADIDPASIDYAMDLFRNEALYNAAAARIGDGDLEYYATGLAVSSAPQLENRLFTGEGCYPHNCGGADSLIVVDKAKGEVYLAQQRDTGITAWPEASQWPEPARAILDRFSAARQ